MRALIDGAAFAGKALPVRQAMALIRAARRLLAASRVLAAD